MDANRYFAAMHNAMSAQQPAATLLMTVELQDLCGNDACLEVKQLPGEETATVYYSTMGRRELNFQLFRKGWISCHNADGQLTGQFPASSAALLEQTDFRAYCRTDRLDREKTRRILQQLEQLAGASSAQPMPQNARTGAQITVTSYVGSGAHWSYWNQGVAPCLPVAAILYWLADHLAGNERRALQNDLQAAQLALKWESNSTLEMFCHPAVSAPVSATRPAVAHPVPEKRQRPVPTCARAKSWQSILTAMAAV